MAWEGYMSLAGDEIVNHARLNAYLNNGFAPTGVTISVCDSCDNLGEMLGEKSSYKTPLLDTAPWIESSNPDTYDFAGVMVLEMTGASGSTRTASVNEMNVDGGVAGRVRYASRTISVSALLLGKTGCSVEAGLNWLSAALGGTACSGPRPVNATPCLGDELCLFTCCPGELDEAPVPGEFSVEEVSPLAGVWQVKDGRFLIDPETDTATVVPNPTPPNNRAANPGVEENISGWWSNDPAKWVVARATTTAIEGAGSALSTRQGVTGVAATNLARNPGAESGSLDGWNSNDGTRYPVALDATSQISGPNSVRVTRQPMNMLTAGANGTFEGGDITGWTITGTGGTVAASTAQKHGGTTSLLGTWGASASANALRVGLSGLVVGQTYRLSGWAYVPTGSVDVRLQVQGIAGQGPDITQRDQWVYSEFSFTATATSHNGQFSSPGGGQAAGTMVYVDDMQLVQSIYANVAASVYLQASGGGGTTAFPCVAGQPVVASIDVKCEQASRRVQLYLSWLDAAGALLGSGPAPFMLGNTGAANVVNRVSITSLPPVNTVQCRVSVQVLSITGDVVVGERVWFDNLRVSTGAATADAVNLHPNPSVGDTTSAGSLTYWSSNSAAAYPVTLDSTAPISGRFSVRSDRTATSLNADAASISLLGLGAGSAMPCTPGVQYTAAVDIKPQNARRVQPYFQWFDAAGAFLSNGPVGAFIPLPANTVTRISWSDTPPAGAVGMRFTFAPVTLDGSNAIVGEQVWFDNARVSAGTETATFTGSTPPDGTYVYTWTGALAASASQRWRVTSDQMRDTTYFDGDTAAAGLTSYRWTGAAKASTSERLVTAVSDPTAASVHFDNGGARLSAEPGVPVTFAVDVKPEQAGRVGVATIAFLNLEDGTVDTATVTTAPLPAGVVTRVLLTATPPPGAVTMRLELTLDAQAGNAGVGERVWLDNLYVGPNAAGHNPLPIEAELRAPEQECWGSPTAFTWRAASLAGPTTVAAGAIDPLTGNVLRRDPDVTLFGTTPAIVFVPEDDWLAWIPVLWVLGNPVTVDPIIRHPRVMTAEECAAELLRSYLDVTTISGPTVVQKIGFGCGEYALKVEWTMAVGNPFMYGPERLLASRISSVDGRPVAGGDNPGSLLGDVTSAYVGQVTAAATTCEPNPEPVLTAIWDPCCPGYQLPPAAPSIPDSCFDHPATWHRSVVSIPPVYTPGNEEGTLTITLRNDKKPKRGVRVRIFPDPVGHGYQGREEGPGLCGFCEEFFVTYIPPSATITIDGVHRRVTTALPGNAAPVVTGASVRGRFGGPFGYPALQCNVGYIVTVDTPDGYPEACAGDKPPTVKDQTQGDLLFDVMLRSAAY